MKCLFVKVFQISFMILGASVWSFAEGPPEATVTVCEANQCMVYDGSNSCETEFPNEFEANDITCADNGLCDLTQSPPKCDSGQNAFFEFKYPEQMEWDRVRQKAKSADAGNFIYNATQNANCSFQCIQRAKCDSICDVIMVAPFARCKPIDVQEKVVQDYVLNMQVPCTMTGGGGGRGGVTIGD